MLRSVHHSQQCPLSRDDFSHRHRDHYAIWRRQSLSVSLQAVSRESESRKRVHAAAAAVGRQQRDLAARLYPEDLEQRREAVARHEGVAAELRQLRIAPVLHYQLAHPADADGCG